MRRSQQNEEQNASPGIQGNAGHRLRKANARLAKPEIGVYETGLQLNRGRCHYAKNAKTAHSRHVDMKKHRPRGGIEARP